MLCLTLRETFPLNISSLIKVYLFYGAHLSTYILLQCVWVFYLFNYFLKLFLYLFYFILI